MQPLRAQQPENTHYHAYWKHTRSSELRIPLYARHAVVVPTVSAVEGFHCNYKIYCEEVTVGSFWGIYMLVFISYQYYLQCGVIKKGWYALIIVCNGKRVSVVAISIALKLVYFLE